MKTTYLNLNKWALGTLFMLGACAQQIPLSDLTTSGTTTTGATTTQTKVCPTSQVLMGTSASKLAEFYGTTINSDYIESVDFCLFIGDLGTGVETGFAVEMEQGSSSTSDTNDGILYLEFGQSSAKRIKSDVIVDSNANTIAIDLIYRDNYGLVEVIGNGTYGDDITATVKFYNFPSYADALQQAAQQAQTDCLAAIAAGNGTAASKCWGLTPAITQAWWLQDITSAQQQLVTAAQSALNSTNGRVLGQITITSDML